MADLADDATPIEFMIHEAMSNLPQVPEHTGTCLLLACGEPTTGAFCSTDCRDDYEKIQRQRKIRGL